MDILLHSRKFKHVNSHHAFIREKKKMAERDGSLERFLDDLLPTHGIAWHEKKNGKEATAKLRQSSR